MRKVTFKIYVDNVLVREGEVNDQKLAELLEVTANALARLGLLMYFAGKQGVEIRVGEFYLEKLQ